MKRFNVLVFVCYAFTCQLFCQAKFNSIEMSGGPNFSLPINNEFNEVRRVNQDISGGVGFKSSLVVFFEFNNQISLGTGFSILKDNYLFLIDNLILPNDNQNGTVSTIKNKTSSFYIGAPLLLKINLNRKKTFSLHSSITYLRNFKSKNVFTNTGGAKLDPAFNSGLETKFPTQNISFGLHGQYLIPITKILDFGISAGADFLLKKNKNILYDSTSQNLIIGVNLGINYKI